MKKGIVIFFLTVVSVVIFLAQQSFAAEKIAYINFVSVFDSYQKTKDYDETLGDLQKTKQKEIEGKVDEIKKLQDKLSLLSEKEKKNKQEDIDTKTKDLQEFQRNAERDLLKAREDRAKEIFKDIEDLITETAKQGGYTLILDSRMVLYGSESLDISKDILDKLNTAYNSKNKKK
jgi:outer membrane protein